MKSYSEVMGRQPDFRIQYEWIEQSQHLFQHMRSDLRYADDVENIVWMVWPEFEGQGQNLVPESESIPDKGYAGM